jgi:hypothetical protein
MEAQSDQRTEDSNDCTRLAAKKQPQTAESIERADKLDQADNLNTPLRAALIDLQLQLFSETFCQKHRLSQLVHSERVYFYF